MACNKKQDNACPFSFTDQSESVQNLGCLPTPYEIIQMRVKHSKTWACHENTNEPCVGAIKHLKKNGLPYKIVDKALVTEKDDWGIYT